MRSGHISLLNCWRIHSLSHRLPSDPRMNPFPPWLKTTITLIWAWNKKKDSRWSKEAKMVDVLSYNLLDCTTFRCIKIGRLWVVLYTELRGLFIEPIRITFLHISQQKILDCSVLFWSDAQKGLIIKAKSKQNTERLHHVHACERIPMLFMSYGCFCSL